MLRAKLFRAGQAADALRRAPAVREHGRGGRRRAPLPDRAARPRRRLDLRLRPHLRRRGRARARAASARASRTRFVRAWRGDVENDGYNRLRARRGAHVARDHGPARDRASTCARRASPSATSTSSGRWSPTRRSRACWWRCSRPASTRARADRRGRAPRWPSGSTKAIDAVESLDQDQILRDVPRGDPGDPPHELLPDRADARPRATSRSSSTPRSSAGCRSRARASRSSSTRRAPRACTCAAARWRAAGSAGPTGARTSAPRCSA